jgi:hypothetical protein
MRPTVWLNGATTSGKPAAAALPFCILLDAAVVYVHVILDAAVFHVQVLLDTKYGDTRVWVSGSVHVCVGVWVCACVCGCLGLCMRVWVSESVHACVRMCQ